MDLFHFKIFERPGIISVVYSIEADVHKSHFVKVEDRRNFLWMPGENPSWIKKVLEIQKNDLVLARKYVLKKIENEVLVNKRHVSAGFEWDKSDYKYDDFVTRAIELAET